MIEVQGPAARRLKARIHGESGPWLVLCHGFGTDQRAWCPIVSRFERDRRVLTFDLAYLNQPAGTRLYADIATYADDVADLLDELDVTDADLLGHSVGAMIMLAATVAVSSRARRLMLLNTSPCYTNEPGYQGGMSPDALEGLLETMRTDYRDWVLRFAPLATSVPVEHRAGSAFVEALLGLGPDLARPVLQSIYELDFRPLLPAVTCPTIVLQGPNDVAVTADATRYLLDHIPNVRRAPLQIEGHLPQLVAPDALADVLAGILAQQP